MQEEEKDKIGLLTNKRTRGKFNSPLRKRDFYSFYRKNNKKPIDQKVYNDFFTDFFKTIVEKMITENLEFKVESFGRFRIRSKKLPFYDINKLKPDWKKTKEHWLKEYPDLSLEEIKKIKNKLIIYHENEHTNGETYAYLWEIRESVQSLLRYYRFIPTRTNNRLLAKILKDPKTKTFYYE